MSEIIELYAERLRIENTLKIWREVSMDVCLLVLILGACGIVYCIWRAMND